ncbi:MAG: hypothetical protein MZW92_72055 [Comamonadaceae bacterium]|nr:hypothetical protein [Comamonadaceae bacterium]
MAATPCTASRFDTRALDSLQRARRAATRRRRCARRRKPVRGAVHAAS